MAPVSTFWTPVHPHACGENARQRFGRADHRRFTPTPVGKTRVTVAERMAGTVHPHACGENRGLGLARSFDAGSPPRLWGKPCSGLPKGARPRFTPTPVGKTGSPDRAPVGARVHPHACGENYAHAHGISHWRGSPPRLWGKHRGKCAQLGARRFTPTPVGKTLPLMVKILRPIGSPPRLWGKRPSAAVDRYPARFTPTPVGKTAAQRPQT